MSGSFAVLVMAYGGPDNMQDLEAYLLDVRHGRPLPPPALAELKRRYELIGGRSPILAHTRAQALQLRAALAALGGGVEVYFGMRHWHPFLEEVALDLVADGVQRLVGLVMAPHYSRMSIEQYYERLQKALAAAGAAIEVERIDSWKDDPGLLVVLMERIQHGLGRFPAERLGSVELIFTAHSLPERILTWDDPYPHELQVTFQALRQAFPAHNTHFAYQSAAMTPDPWLGPDVGQLVDERLGEGVREFLVVPIGFVSEHVEILYDLDIDLRQRIEAGGGHFERTEMPGADPRLMASLASRVRTAASARGWL